jgi:hypothetical protein
MNKIILVLTMLLSVTASHIAFAQAVELIGVVKAEHGKCPEGSHLTSSATCEENSKPNQ